MRAKQFITESTSGSKERFVEMFSKFLPLAMQYLKLDSLPKIVFEKKIESTGQPTFGMYVTGENVLYVALVNRHPNDILRTVAHELQHYKQDTQHQLDDESGTTGSAEENEAHAMAGIVMRHFNKQYPEYLNDRPVISESWTKKYKSSINCSNPKGFSQRAHCQGRNKNESTDSIEERKRKRKKVKSAAYGPGPYGWYGFDAGYSGNGGDAGGGIEENFADGRNPQDKGDSKRHGVPTKASVSTLRKVAKQGGRKGQLAHWMANMKAGKAKKK
jgi:hypothetical protein